jgi:hypothetical protein
MIKVFACRTSFGFIFFFLIQLMPFYIFGQQPSNLITISASDEKLSSVLSHLSGFDGVNLSFNASDPMLEKRVTFSITNKTIEEILEELLPPAQQGFSQVGNNLVIFPRSDMPDMQTENANNDKDTEKAGVSNASILVADTVYKYIEVPVTIHDTIRIVEMETRTDTIRIRDTVFVEKPVTQFRRTQGVSVLRNIFRFEPDREDGWAVSFSYSQLLAGYHYNGNETLSQELEKVKNADSASFRNFSLGTAAQLNQGKFNIAAGVQLTGFSNRFSFSDLTTSGGFYDVDTLDVFYTIIDGLPVYTYITDSLWVPLDRDELRYDRFNRIGLLELQLALGYTFYADENITGYINGAFSAGTPVWLSGSAFSENEYTEPRELKEVFENWTYAWQAGFGMRYSIGNWSDIYGEVFYKRYLYDFVQDYPLQRRMHGAGLKIGLLYYL